MPSVSPDGPDLSGPPASPVSRSVAPVRVWPSETKDTYGPLFGGLSRSAALQQSLENRLRVRMAAHGSMEYELTWKHWAMSSGLPICALRAAERPISGKGSTGWPTPNTPSGGPNTKSSEKHTGGIDLEGAASLAGWPTSTVNDSRGGRNRTSGRSNPDSQHHDGLTLCDAALIAGWPTASARDWKDTPGMSQTGTNPDGSERTRLDQLPRVAALAGWATPRAEDSEQTGAHRGKADTLTSQGRLAGWGTPRVTNNGGIPCPEKTGKGSRLEDQAAIAGWPSPSANGSAGETSEDLERVGSKWRNKKTGRILQTNLATEVKLLTPGQTGSSSPVPTGKRGALNPDLSRWLMGYPVEWGYCGATAMRSCRRSRRSS